MCISIKEENSPYVFGDCFASLLPAMLRQPDNLTAVMAASIAMQAGAKTDGY